MEMAGAIAELAHRSASKDFRSITPHCSRVVLIHRGKRLLQAFPETLSQAALNDICKLGVDVRLGKAVTSIGDDHVMIDDELIPANTIVWATGVKASPAAQWLGCEADSSGRVIVDETLRTQASDRIFVIGDTAHCTDPDGRPLPGIAPVAWEPINPIFAPLASMSANVASCRSLIRRAINCGRICIRQTEIASGMASPYDVHMGRIILADDAEIVGEIVSSALMSAGHAVGWLQDGKEALDAMLFRPPDLAILDVHMPEMSGFETLRKMRQRTELASVPVLMLTVVEGEGDQRIAYFDGANDYMTKPFDPDELVVRAETLMDKFKGAKS